MPVTAAHVWQIQRIADARRFIISYLKQRLANHMFVMGQTYGYGLYIQGILASVYQTYVGMQPNALGNKEEIGRFLMDAAWQLALKGHLRPGLNRPFGQPVNEGHGNGYSFTISGEQWLNAQADPHHSSCLDFTSASSWQSLSERTCKALSAKGNRIVKANLRGSVSVLRR